MGATMESAPVEIGHGDRAAKDAQQLRKESKRYFKLADILVGYPDVKASHEELETSIELLWVMAGEPELAGLDEDRNWHAEDVHQWCMYRHDLMQIVDLHEAAMKIVEHGRSYLTKAIAAEQRISQARSMAAKHVIDDRALEKTSAISERLYRMLDRAYERYAKLRSGESIPRNEPTEPGKGRDR